MLQPEKLLAPENETLLRKQEKPMPERESAQPQQEEVLEEELLKDLQEDEDARIFSSFLFTFDTNKKIDRNIVSVPIASTVF